MPTLEKNLPAERRSALAIDTSEYDKAMELASVAHKAGASVVKLGLELITATSPQACSDIAKANKLDWVADAKLDDIPNTVAGAVRNLSKLAHPPVGITVHTNSGIEAMQAAEEIASANGITMLGVTLLTSISQEEAMSVYGMTREEVVDRRLRSAVIAGIGGYVCSPKELAKVVNGVREYEDMFGFIPGTRSVGADAQDQKNVLTPYQAILDGADMLVIGRQVTGAADPAAAFEAVTAEIQQGIDERSIA
ncbi:MAG: Orotidine-5-phosphate decarboxylase [Candidatus Saccharibacteria bacterium]|nr:Orotidine-5-phosphate decarboxylase [Candidatus Saccharibacteria bacterium]